MGNKKLSYLISIIFLLLAAVGFIYWYYSYLKPVRLFDQYVNAYVNEVQICPTPKSAQLLQEGFTIDLKKAKGNHADAEYKIGIAYLNGIGTEPNPTQGLIFIKSAAEHGSPMAQAVYGYLLSKDPKTAASAIDWYTKSANQGNPYGQYMLATAYLQQNNNAKFFSLMSSAAKNLGIAKYLLARAYQEGLGTDIDLKKAVNLYKEAIQDPKLASSYKVLIADRLSLIYQQGFGDNAAEQAQYWSNQAVRFSQQKCQVVN